MTERRINLEHLELVLFTRRLSRVTNKPLSTFAAVSNGGFTTHRCRHDRFHSGPARHDYARPTPPMLMPLLPSVTPALVLRTRMTYGLPEVKRTWGTGLKALVAEISSPSRAVCQ